MSETNTDGAVDLIDLINKVLVARFSAMRIAFEKRDVDLSEFVSEGHDTEALSLLVSHAADAAHEAQEALEGLWEAKVTRREYFGDMAREQELVAYVRGLHSLCDEYARLIDLMEQTPPLCGKSTSISELLSLLREQEAEQQEAGRREQAEAEAAAASID